MKLFFNGWNEKKGTGSLHELIPFFEERERNMAPFFEKELGTERGSFFW